MPLWLTVTIAVVGLIGTLLGIVGFTAYWNERMKHKAERRNRAEDRTAEEIERMRHETYVKELKTIINGALDEALTPVKNDLAEVKEDLCLVKNGLQKDLYVDLESLYKEYRKNKCASLDEKKSYDSLYWAYHNLGKNGVADGMHNYVMNSLSDTKEAPKRKSQSSKKKKLLVEGK